MATRRRPTKTSSFGAGKRESHDASEFYARFTPPHISSDDAVRTPRFADEVVVGDSRTMTEVTDASVALVVTSPPYFVGKDYEASVGQGGVPGDYVEYLKLLADVFRCCVSKLEPGGRLAVNVANLGRRPFRSLSSDVIRIFEELGLLLRGEIIWQKGRRTSGSCAWGTFQSPANPVLRDVTERVVVASKGRFDRALARKKRSQRDLPSVVTISRDEFMEATTDLWEIAPESARRVGHPAPFPVELPQRLIELYTYEDDLVLDPFLGSGSTALAALRTARRYVGYDLDPKYIELARDRIAREAARLSAVAASRAVPPRVSLPAVPPAEPDEEPNFQARAVREGKKAQEIALAILQDCQFSNIRESRRVGGGVTVNFEATDRLGDRFYFDVSGAFVTTNRAGLRRTDTAWKALGRAGVLRAVLGRLPPLVLLTTNLPSRGSAGDVALRAARGHSYLDAIEMLSAPGQQRLREYAAGGARDRPVGDLLPPQGHDHE